MACSCDPVNENNIGMDVGGNPICQIKSSGEYIILSSTCEPSHYDYQTLALAKTDVDALVLSQGAYAAAQTLGLGAVCPYLPATGVQTQCPQCMQSTTLCNCPAGWSVSGDTKSCCDPQSGTCFTRTTATLNSVNCKGGVTTAPTCIAPPPATCNPWQIKDALGNCVTNPCPPGQYRNSQSPYTCVVNPCCN